MAVPMTFNRHVGDVAAAFVRIGKASIPHALARQAVGAHAKGGDETLTGPIEFNLAA
jgi:hypothetical protein